MEPYRDYDPLEPPERYAVPERTGFAAFRDTLRKLFGPLIAAIIFLAKFGFIGLKFASIFIAIGAYALIWGWRFAVGFVALIFIHEMGHFIEARRHGLNASWPTFIPFLGAYVTIRGDGLNPWTNAQISLAGPIVGGVGATIFWAIGEHTNSQLLQALGYAGFMINLFNLLPIGIPRRRPDHALGALPAARRRQRQGALRLRALRGDGGRARARDDRGARPPDAALDARRAAHPPGRRRRPGRPPPSRSGSSSARASSRSRAMTKPAVALFGSARVAEEHPAYGSARAVGKCFAEHGWAVITGGGGGVMEGANRGAQEGGGLRSASTSSSRTSRARTRTSTSRHLQALLRAQGLLREAGRGLRDLSGRLRHARRAVRVADADPDGQGARLPGRALRLGLLGRAARLAAEGSCSPAG